MRKRREGWRGSVRAKANVSAERGQVDAFEVDRAAVGSSGRLRGFSGRLEIDGEVGGPSLVWRHDYRA